MQGSMNKPTLFHEAWNHPDKKNVKLGEQQSRKNPQT